MFAALKGTIIEAVLYGTQDDVYPKWLREEVIDELFEDSTGELQYRLTDETDDDFKWFTFEPYETVILRNKYKDIYTTLLERFEKLYNEIGPGLAALKEDCVEYYILTKDTNLKDIPKWIKSRIDDDGVLYMDNDLKWWDSSYPYGDFKHSVQIPCMFIRNTKGEIRQITVGEFERCFDAPDNPKYYKELYKED